MTSPEDTGPPPPDGYRLRVPPHSSEAEQSLLGALLTDATAWSRAADAVSEADFYVHQHRVIFGAIGALLADRKPADIVTVFEALQVTGQAADVGGLPYLNALAQGVVGTANVRRYAEIVRERAIQRRLIAVSDEIATGAFKQGGSIAQMLDAAQDAIAHVKALAGPGASRRVPLLGLDELRQHSDSIRWLCKRVIPADSVGMLFGGSGTFKSFLALDLALHVAHGLEWMGRKTRQGPVVFIAAEGGAGLWPRVQAWHLARGLEWRDAPLKVVPVALDLTADAWRVVDAAQIAGVTPALVVVDTLSQTYVGEENSANEMAAYLRGLGSRFRALWHCAVLVIHHSGHAATERPRGSSAIRANLDFLLGCFRDEKEMLATLTCIKQKDGEPFEDATFQLSGQYLGTDEDGDSVMQLAARHLSHADEVSDAMEHEVKHGRGGKNQLLLKLLQNGMKEATLRKAFYEDCGLADADSRRQAYFRASSWAKKLGFYEVAEGIVIVTKAKG